MKGCFSTLAVGTTSCFAISTSSKISNVDASKIVFKKYFAPILGPCSLEIGPIMAVFYGGINTHFPGKSKWIGTLKRTCGWIVKRTTSIADHEYIAGRVHS